MTYLVKVGFDEDTRRYFIIEADIPGLNVEAKTFEELVEITQDLAGDLLEAAAGTATIRFEREVALAS